MSINHQNHKSWYDTHYYACECGRPYQRDEEWLKFFGSIADHIVQDIHPTTVLDAGCAMGFLVECLRERGVEAYGIDISEYAIQNVNPVIASYCSVGSIVDPFPQRYDLIVCIEVLEHMPTRKAESVPLNFAMYTDDVLFSSSPFDYSEVTHINVHPSEYWAALFAKQGFFHDLDFDATFLTPWAMRFRRQNDPFPRVVQAYERKLGLLLRENTDLHNANLELYRQLKREDFETLERNLAEREAYISHLERLIAGYEQGRFIRLMKWLRARGKHGTR